MTSRTKARTIRGWDIGLAAAILAVVLLGWLTAPGSNAAAPHHGQLVSRGVPPPGSINDPPGHLPHR
jgi:hypothetical protein